MPFQPVSSEDLKKNQKAASSVDLTKTDSLRKNSQDGRCVCGSVNVCADTFLADMFITVAVIWG